MAFRLPSNLLVGGQYGVVTSDFVTALEESLPSNSRMLVGLVFSERYEGFEEDCEKAELELQKQAGLYTWPELDHFITPDVDGEPIAWVSYRSSPAWWLIILGIVGVIFALPIIGSISIKIIDWIFPGTIETIQAVIMLVIVGGLMLFLPKMFKPAEEKG